MVNPTGYSKTSPNSSGYGAVRKNTFFLLLQTGDFLLQQDGASKIILESGVQTARNYAKTSPNPTNYSTPS